MQVGAGRRIDAATGDEAVDLGLVEDRGPIGLVLFDLGQRTRHAHADFIDRLFALLGVFLEQNVAADVLRFQHDRGVE